MSFHGIFFFRSFLFGFVSIDVTKVKFKFNRIVSAMVYDDLIAVDMAFNAEQN